MFPSRFFRHSCIFVSAKSGIREPKDLAGKKIGVPEYQMTAPVWIRGILQDEYGVDPAGPEYWTGGEEEPGRDEKLELELPAKFRLKSIGPKQTLAQMISDGELDAMHTARTPSSFYTRPGTVRRLFENYVEVEKAYYRKTKIFPIMHTVVIRRELYEKNRWIAQSLYKAFVQAQRRTYETLDTTMALTTMLPWQAAHVEEARRELGEDWWPYGFEPNRRVLETFLRYHHQQGLSKRRLKAEELFAPTRSAACCARKSSSGRASSFSARRPRPALSARTTARNCARWRTNASARSSPCRSASGSGRAPTANSAGAAGGWS